MCGIGSMPKWSSINLMPNTYVHTQVFGCLEGSVVGSGKINKVLGLLTKRFFFSFGIFDFRASLGGTTGQ